MKTIENQTFDMERALYGSRDVEVKNCQVRRPGGTERARSKNAAMSVRITAFSICGTRSGMTTAFGSRIRR